jgi:hypothetical protein
MKKLKPKRVKILRTLKPENAEILRTEAFVMRKSQSQILDELLEGYTNRDV